MMYKFCPECGNRLEKKPKFFWDLNWFRRFLLRRAGYTPYDQQIGEQKAVYQITCPYGHVKYYEF